MRSIDDTSNFDEFPEIDPKAQIPKESDRSKDWVFYNYTFKRFEGINPLPHHISCRKQFKLMLMEPPSIDNDTDSDVDVCADCTIGLTDNRKTIKPTAAEVVAPIAAAAAAAKEALKSSSSPALNDS